MSAYGPAPDISALLETWGRGDLAARDQLVPLVYEELRRRAKAYLRRERVGHALQPTALVHETYLRLSLEETGHVLHTSIATVEREWRAARAWLFSHLKGRCLDA